MHQGRNQSAAWCLVAAGQQAAGVATGCAGCCPSDAVSTYMPATQMHQWHVHVAWQLYAGLLD